MPSGLQVRNAFGTVQVDENWRNYGFKYKFTIYETLNWFNDAVHIFRFSAMGAAVTVAYESEFYHVVPRQSTFDGTTWWFTYQIRSHNTAEYPIVPTTLPVTFYVFDVPTSEAFSNVGLEVFDSAGRRGFHSDMDLMKVRGVQPCNVPFVGTPGRKYVPRIVLNPLWVEGNLHFTRSLRVAGNQITTERLGPISNSLASWVSNEGLYAAVDVTGL